MGENDNCHVETLDKLLDREALSSVMVAYLAVGGMGCPNCAMRVRNGLINLEGVLTAYVDLGQGLAAAAYNPKDVSPDDLVRAVANAGNYSRHHYWAQFIQQVPVSRLLG